MGFFDYVSDIYSSLSIQSVEAEAQNSSQDQQGGGVGTAEQDRGATTRGGVSTKSPASGTDEESDEEAEVNKSDVKKSEGSGEKGQVAGAGGDASGQVGADNAGPHGGPVGKDDDDEEEEESADDEEEEEEEEEEEPEDLKPKFEEECMETKECAPAKHHYDHCVERVTKQQEENGKANEDCVEEFFHLAHCATACAAPKLFKALR